VFPDTEFEQVEFDWVHIIGTARHLTNGEPLDDEGMPVPLATPYDANQADD
jgi:hypothetical protein